LQFRPNRSSGSRVIAFSAFSNMAAVRHLEFEFYHSEPHEVNCAVQSPYQNLVAILSDLRRRIYCDFMTVPVWLENA